MLHDSNLTAMWTHENTLMLDMDGVLADFDKGARAILGMEPKLYEEKYGTEKFWEMLNAAPDFFGNLDPMPDAFELYNAVAHIEPMVLTGIPKGMDPHNNSKIPWIKKHLGSRQRVICCQASKKWQYIYRPGDILVDDKHFHKKKWEKNGGIFILHTSAERSIRQLRDIGVPVR